MSPHSDIVVIGAGVHGVSAAFHLAGRGRTVTVVDRGAPAGGPTGRSSAVCRAYYTNAWLAAVARESLDMLARFEDEVGGPSGWVHTGALFLHGAGDVDQVRRTSAMLNGLGTSVSLLDADALEAAHPRLNPSGLALGAWEEGAGYADPVTTTNSMLAGARARGAEVRLFTRVHHIGLRDGGGAVVHTDDGGQLACDRLLVCAGPWTRPLLEGVGVSLPLRVERHITGTFGWGGAARLPHAIADVPGGYYLRPDGTERFLVGPLHEEPVADPDDFDEAVGPDEEHRLVDMVQRRIPDLGAAEVRAGWASLYDVSPDWQPVIGEVADGIFVDAGTSGHGFKLAPALGRRVADLVCGDAVPGIEQFHPRRFDTDSRLGAGYAGAQILG